MLLREGGRRISRVKLVDFGIARLSKTVFANQSQTATGLVFGTPFYMSPEQCQGLKVDERSDVYSFGCTFFEALTGEVPFAGSTSVEIFMQHLSHPQPSLASKGKTAFPPALELAVAKMLSKAPADRYENMEQIKYDLERILQGKEIRIQDGSRASLNSAVRAGETAAASSRSLSGRLPGQAGGRLSQKARNKSKASKVPLIVVSTLASIIAIVGLFALYRHLLVNDLPVETKHAGKSATPLWDLDDVGKPKYLAAADTGKANDKVGRSPVDDGGTSASVDALQDFGEDYDQTTIMVSKGINKFIRDEKEWKLRFADYSNDRKRLLSKFRPIGSENLVFPDNFSFGQISIDGASPRPAMGQFRCPRGAEVYWHGDCMTRTFNQVMYKWNADDLTGLDVVFTRPRPVIEMLSKWSRLRDLCFFNTLSKAMTPELDESRLTNEDLPLLEHFPKLRSLGLCDADLSGLAIAKMPLLHRLEGLKLKRIARIDAVLAVLPQLDNIKELWLVDVKTKDEDIDVLARMKNLENLRIRRGKLTAKSLAKFVKMPKLKHLYLDCTLSPEEKADFKAAMPYCEFEPVIDVTYWQMLPEK